MAINKKFIFFAAGFLLILSPGIRAQQEDIRSITVLYDNQSARDGVEADWGFSCLIRGFGKKILFDTGAKADILSANMKEMGIDPGEPEILVLSHMHSDHIGGLRIFQTATGRLKAFIPSQWPSRFESTAFGGRMNVVKIDGFTEIAENAYLTGGLGGEPFTGNTFEQALVFDTPSGLTVVTGCSHPGIVPILGKIRETFKRDIDLVLGGFHLLNLGESRIGEIIVEMKNLGVRRCAATHCTGENAIRLFRKAFGDDFIQAGAGTVLTFR